MDFMCSRLKNQPKVCSDNSESIPFEPRKQEFWGMINHWGIILVIILIIEGCAVGTYIYRKAQKEIIIEAEMTVKKYVKGLGMKKGSGNEV